MRELVSAGQMKDIDRRSIDAFGIPSLVLMERAALAVAETAKRVLSGRDGGRVLSVCGFGNNGADGLTAARMLALWGYETMILLPDAGGAGTEEFDLQLQIAKKLGIPVYTAGDDIPGHFDVILDAVFGIGLSRPVEGIYASLVDYMEREKSAHCAKIISVDIPSGIDADTGQVLGKAVFADHTVTFGTEKLGQVLYPGREACGNLILADIGFVPQEEAVRKSFVRRLEPADLGQIPSRRPDSHKGTWGKILIAAGSENMAGAAYLSALAAYRTGAGLVKVFTAEENRLILQERLSEAILSTWEKDAAEEDPETFCENVKAQIGWADAIVLGPGIGTGETARLLVETVLANAYVPIILDADALNLAARWPQFKGYFTENIIVTPHVMEFSRLTGQTAEEIKADSVRAARTFAEEYGVTCVLKDAATVIARKDGQVFVNTSGSPAMAKGGAGDVLTGVIAGFLAIGLDEADAAVYGAYVHGRAGEIAAERRGIHSVLAGEIAEALGEAMRI